MGFTSKKIIWLLCALLISAGCGQKISTSQSPPGLDYSYTRTLQIADQSLAVEIANTPEKMQLGLGKRETMPDNHGMLFDFKTQPTAAGDFGITPNFWMKDMKFNLDLIWIKSGRIIGITPDVPAPTENLKLTNGNSSLPLYSPPSPVDAVLEVNAGWAKKNKIKTGSVVRSIN